MPVKTVRVRCYEPIAVDAEARQSWGDVWIRFTTKPGRRVVRLAITLISRSDLERKDGDETLALLATVGRDGIALDLVTPPGLPRGYRLLTIYTVAPTFDRAEAERMIRHLLVVYCGIERCRLVWLRPKVTIVPL